MTSKKRNPAEKDSQKEKEQEAQGQGPAVLSIRDVILEAVEAQKDIDKVQGKVEKLEEEIKASKTSVAEHLMITAKPYKTDADAFNKACKEQMAYLKSDEAGKGKLDKIPRCFVQAKSDILAAMKLGIDPNEAKNYLDLKEKKVDARKGGEDKGEQEQTEVIDLKSDIGQALQDLFDVLHEVPEEKAPVAAQAIKHFANDLRVQLYLEGEEEQEQEEEQKQAASA